MDRRVIELRKKFWFPKGKSGNPRGRPPGQIRVEIAKRNIEAELSNLHVDPQDFFIEKSNFDSLMLQVIIPAAKKAVDKSRRN